MASITKTALDRVTQATGKAFDKVRSNTGQETYRPLEIYQKLKPEDFASIADRYGIENTINYIRQMESRRMMGKEK